MSTVLRYRAGPRALARIRDRGLLPEDVRVVVGTASGPRWLALVGLDRALIELGLGAADEGDGAPARLLVGASAGAWRMLAFATADPRLAHERLVDGYIGQVFPRNVRPRSVSESYRHMLRTVFPETAVRHALSRTRTDLGIHVARLRGRWPWTTRALQASMIAVTAAARRLGPTTIGSWVERVMLHSSPGRFRPAFDGTVARLDDDNLVDAALASGTVPVYMRPVDGIAGAPPGSYVDGGLMDYHLRQRYVERDEGVVLLPHFQRGIVAGWMDRYARRPPPLPDGLLDDVLQIYPSRRFVERLPDARLPDRDDFFRFVDDPEERIRRWHEAVDRSGELGKALLRDLETGRLPDRIEPLR